MDGLLQQMQEMFSGYLPRLAGALGVLVVGWLLALLAGAIVRGALKRTRIDDRLFGWLSGRDTAKGVSVAQWAGRIAYYVILVFTLIAFLQVLELSRVSEPLNGMLQNVFGYLPQIASAGLLLLLAWVVASIVRTVVGSALSAARLDERLGDTAAVGEPPASVSKSIASALYWIVFLLFLPLVLDALSLEGLLVPLQDMLTNVLGYLPRIFAAGIILLVGWFVARIVRQIVSNLLAAAGADRIGRTEDGRSMFGEQRLSGLVGLVAYVMVLVPSVIAALEALRIEAISGPASRVLETMLAAVPSIVTAALVLLIAYFVGRFLADVSAQLLSGFGFDNILVTVGVAEQPPSGRTKPSSMIGTIVHVVIVFIAAIEAAGLLGFDALAGMLVQFAEFAGQVAVGIVILGAGLYIANLAHSFIKDSQPPEREILATAARVAILVLAGAMALRHMGLANEIISVAFGAILLAIALAAALAFGLGAREVAGEEVRRWLRERRGSGGTPGHPG